MKKIIICLIIIFTPLLVRADGHASKESSLVGEGAFNTLHVKAKNIGKYLTNLKSNTSTFKAIGADAAAANLLFVFKIPASIEDKLTKSKKGKVILVNSTAKLNFSLSTKKPGAIR